MHWQLLCLSGIFVILVHGETFSFTRVLNGSPASIQQYPILAQMLLDVWGLEQHIQHCAGVILTSRHVISTAHCFQYNRETGKDYSMPQFWRIRVGSSFRTRGGALHKVKSIVKHYGFDKNYYTNDIAVVVVWRKFTFNHLVGQATIIKPESEVPPNSLCTLVGWGATHRDGPQPDQLQYTNMFLIDHGECTMMYDSIGAVITESMMCAGRTDIDGVDGCYGDSGGPLIYKGVVVGLVSFGYACGLRYYPGIYTKLSHYTDWIIQTISTNK